MNLATLNSSSNGIIQYLSFRDWLISHSILSLRSIHVIVCVRISFPFKVKSHWIAYTTFYLPVSPLMDAWVASSLAIVNSASVHISIVISLWDSVFNSFGYYPEEKSRVDTVVLFPILRSAILFSIVAKPFYIPIHSTQRFQFLYILTNSFPIRYFLFLLLPFWIVAILIGCGEYPPIFKASVFSMTWTLFGKTFFFHIFS